MKSRSHSSYYCRRCDFDICGQCYLDESSDILEYMMIQTPISEADAVMPTTSTSLSGASEESLTIGLEHLHEAFDDGNGPDDDIETDLVNEADDTPEYDNSGLSPELRTLSFLVSTSISLSTATISTMEGEQKNIALNRLSSSLIAQLSSQANLR